jgi:hypothetical protein
MGYLPLLLLEWWRYGAMLLLCRWQGAKLLSAALGWLQSARLLSAALWLLLLGWRGARLLSAAAAG